MSVYFWEEQQFFTDFKKEILDNKPATIRIASAYISMNGATSLKNVLDERNLLPENIEIYCSSKFNELAPARVLNFLSTFAEVFIVNKPFLHTKVYEIDYEDETVIYSGSANLTDGGLLNNLELMTKNKTTDKPLAQFWGDLWQISVEVTNEVIELYESFPLTTPPEAEQQKVKVTQFEKRLAKIYEQQVTESEYPDLTGFYFEAEDYIPFAENYRRDSSMAIREQRQETKKKILDLHYKLEPMVKKLDLHRHYSENHITNGIDPSEFNHGRVTGIWVRYGKHETELNPFGSSGRSRIKTERSPLEQFHKHACLQFSIGSHGINIGMFHSTANDGVDRGYVRENWREIKQKIIKVYDQLIGYDFYWTFYDAINNKPIASFDFNEGTSEEFVDFYFASDVDGYESFCMRNYDMTDDRIKTQNGIISEIIETFTVIEPLHQAMSFRIPVDMR